MCFQVSSTSILAVVNVKNSNSNEHEAHLSRIFQAQISQLHIQLRATLKLN